MEKIVVVGAGVAGLTTALKLARSGLRVTVLDRDDVSVAADPDAAFAVERPGAPQVHQTHGFLARLQVVLRDEFPDIYDGLMAAGCTTMTTTANLGEPEPGDEDLRVLILRRTTLDWVLRRAAIAEPGIDLRTRVGVTGLVADGVEPVRVTGVALDDGSCLEADAVVVANGRRSNLLSWLRESGIEVPETEHESGLMYVTRWYRFPGDRRAELDPKLGGDLGFVKYLGVPGDGETLSVTLAISSTDTELRTALNSEDAFDLACRSLPGPDRFFETGPLAPLGGVRVMAGLLNRIRGFVDGRGEPTALGLHVVGDAHTCTNPLYGRGCSLAAVQAVLLARAFAAHGDDHATRAKQYEAECDREIRPWFDVSVQMDRLGADPTGFAGSGEGRAMATVFVAAATDPVIGRAMARFWNLMATPADLAADPRLLARMGAVMADPDSYPVPPREGPTRTQLLDILGRQEDAA